MQHIADGTTMELQRQLHIREKDQQGPVRRTLRFFNSMNLRSLWSFTLDVKDFPVVAYCVYDCLSLVFLASRN